MCAHAVRVVVGKIEGVQSVKVSLKEGVATIQFAPSNRVTVSKIREAVRSNGFTAREAEIRVAGSLAHRGDTLVLIVPSTDEVFALQAGPGATATMMELRRRGPKTRVVLAGLVLRPRARDDRGPHRMLVRSFAGVT